MICDAVLPQLSGVQIRDWVAARHAHLLPRLWLMTSESPATMPEEAGRNDLEYKVKMKPGATLAYSWSVTGDETHTATAADYARMVAWAKTQEE